MNKYYLDGVLVVEGKSDVSYLSSFIKTLYFTTNGYDINEEKLDFLERVSQVNKVIVMTDNDQAGSEIENRIKSKINNTFVVKSHKITRKNYKKSGVAETDYNEIINALSEFIKPYENQVYEYDYKLNQIISCSDEPELMRNRIINDYRLIKGNNKYLQQQLSMLKVNPKEFVKNYGNK